MVTCFDIIHKCDGQQDGRTDRGTDTARQHYPRLCIASHGKNFKAEARSRLIKNCLELRHTSCQVSTSLTAMLVLTLQTGDSVFGAVFLDTF